MKADNLDEANRIQTSINEHTDAAKAIIAGASPERRPSEPAERDPKGETKIIDVSARAEWLAVADLKKGARVTIKVTGEWQAGGSPAVLTGPDGVAPNGEKRRDQELIGRVGKGGEHVLIGRGTSFKVPVAGTLELRIRDTSLSDNGGAVVVTITQQ